MNHTKSQVSFISWRFYFSLAILLLGLSGLIFRIIYLSIWEQDFLRHQGDERVLRLSKTPTFRGMIMDRSGFPLAVSTVVYSAWVNPKEFQPSINEKNRLAKLLAIHPNTLSSLLAVNRKKKRSFLYLSRAITPKLADEIKELHYTGLYLQPESRRFYPEGEVFSHVLGFTNVDDKGQEGLELYYNQWLEGELGKKWVIKDRLGRVISTVQSVSDQKPGKDIVLSLDRRIQYLAYRSLLAGITENEASSGSVVVLDVHTGEVLGMVNYPSFNPNNRKYVKPEAFRNRAVTDTFEPGSTIKAFSIASALDARKFRPDSVVDTSPGWLRVGRNLVRDERNHEQLTVAQILQVSSNVGVTKLILSLPPNHLWDLLSRVGFGETTGIGFPGEQSGSLIKHDPWGSFVLATLGFGYGVSVTPLQLARAYAVLANGGIKTPISLLRLDEAPKGEHVMSEKTTQQMLLLLEDVVNSKEGTGKLSSIQGYRVAGKTGTAKKAGAHGYEKRSYIASFVGMAPVSHPRFVVAVIINNPKGKLYHGGSVASPVFQKVMEGALRFYDVSPDAA